MSAISELSIPVLLFALAIVFGVWLTRAGKPYNGMLFNVHKLIALGGVIVGILRIYGLVWPVSLAGLVTSVIVTGGVCIVALFASGALMSMGKTNQAVALTIHRVGVVGLSLGVGLLVYSLLRRV